MLTSNPTTKKHIAVVGAQLGDEGKGKLVDLLSAHAEVVARYNGGNNAGHTVNRNGEVFKFRSLPSGTGIPGVLNIIGNGAVVNVADLLAEITGMAKEHHLQVTPKDLQISEIAHLALSLHKELDVFREEQNRGTPGFIGTTGNGIGPAYADKTARIGIRAGDLLHLDRAEAQAALRSKIHAMVARHFPELSSFAAKNLVYEKKNAKKEILARLVAKDLYSSLDAVTGRIEEELLALAPAFAPYVATKVSASDLLKNADLKGERILYEGGQSVLLDIDHGTVPYVTSSSTGGNAVANGTGYKTHRALHVLGVAKAYVTRVGSGPFPSMMVGSDAPIGDEIREKGAEFGTVTGRSRDIGWFDLVAMKQAIQAGGIESLALMKADILDDLAEIAVAVSYQTAVGEMKRIPPQSWLWQGISANLVRMKGWKGQGAVLNAKKKEDLPPAFLDFIRFIEQETQIPVAIVGTGSEREQVIVLRPELF